MSHSCISQTDDAGCLCPIVGWNGGLHIYIGSRIPLGGLCHGWVSGVSTEGALIYYLFGCGLPSVAQSLWQLIPPLYSMFCDVQCLQEDNGGGTVQ